MIATAEPQALDEAARHALNPPTVWGLTPIELHDRFWAARGVCVVRLGERREIPRSAELFLLTDHRTLAIFRLASLIDTLSWVRPSVMFVRLASRHEQGYSEQVLIDDRGQFLRIHRSYGSVQTQVTRVALTCNAETALAWQCATDAKSAWKKLRHEARRKTLEVASLPGRVYDRATDQGLSQFVSDLVKLWNYPPATIADVQPHAHGVWTFGNQKADPSVRFVGPVWIGAGRRLDPEATVVGPAVLWDDPSARPRADGVRWSELEPKQVLAAVRQSRVASQRRPEPIGKRLFDIAFSLAVIIVTLPLQLLVMLLILLEDGRPIFFLHKRETRGGREFQCLKFRSMRKDAEQIKARLIAANRADGPQFYIPDDPRLTRIGRFIRRHNIDELPQFINVLLGQMSVVGPRPSPRAENQFNPTWREGRLSVRAGVTGLWQVRRTRKPGLDFQEWIKYDLEYVQNVSWRLDLLILWRTFRLLSKW